MGRSLANGKKMFSAGLCVACHRFGTEGGGIGPDLTNLAKRSDYNATVARLWNEPKAIYAAMVTAIDDGVGRGLGARARGGAGRGGGGVGLWGGGGGGGGGGVGGGWGGGGGGGGEGGVCGGGGGGRGGG